MKEEKNQPDFVVWCDAFLDNFTDLLFSQFHAFLDSHPARRKKKIPTLDKTLSLPRFLLSSFPLVLSSFRFLHLYPTKSLMSSCLFLHLLELLDPQKTIYIPTGLLLLTAMTCHDTSSRIVARG